MHERKDKRPGAVGNIYFIVLVAADASAVVLYHRNELSWTPRRTGQGGEGMMSKSYGGSEGRGTGPSGPEDEETR